MRQMKNSEKTLFKITNLRQWFPLKHGEYVKANDGINLEIKEGEIFGLVGESGCGKSTFGRTLLQLYRQTDGQTLYYGRSLEDLAPKYVLDTLHNLEKNRSTIFSLEKKKNELQEKFDKASEKEQFAMHAELDAAIRSYHNAMLNTANIVGGLFVAKDLGKVKEVFDKHYKLCRQRHELTQEIKRLSADKEDAQYAKKNTQSFTSKIAQATKKIDELNAKIADSNKTIDALREAHKNDEGFDTYDVYYDQGIDLARLTYDEIRVLRQDLQIVFQDPYSSLNPRFTVGQAIGEGLIAHNIYGKNSPRMQEYILKTMSDCGLQPYFLHRYPFQFSGGQRQRISIARALAVNPKFVVLDESVSALDVSIQAQIINLLQDLKEKGDLTYLFITHDLSVVKYISDRIGVMYLGNLVELSPSDKLFQKPLHPYTQALITAIPTTDPDVNRELKILEGDIPSPVHPPKGCKFHTRCRFATEKCRHITPEWRELEPNHFVACHHPLTGDGKPDDEQE